MSDDAIRKRTMKKEEKGALEEGNQVMKKLEDMDNKLERIKSDTHSLNRVACISNAPVIIQELWKAVGRSEVRAAILYLAKEEIGAKELVQALGIKEENLAMYMKPFLGNKGFIAELKRGRNKYFQRSEQVDLIGFEKEQGFIELVESWKAKRAVQAETETSVPPKEEADAA